MGKKPEPVTLRVERDGRELWRSSASGLRPLVEAVLTVGEGLRGATVYDKVVGLASAKLLVYVGVREVEADVASAPAVRYAERPGLLLKAMFVTPRILNRECTGLCPMEELALEVESPDAFLRAVVRRLGLAEGDVDDTGKVG